MTSSTSNSTHTNDVSAHLPKIPSSDTEDERLALRNELRAEARRARSEMPAPYRAHKSAELCKRLEESLALTLGITNTAACDAVIAVYSAFPEEVDLRDFIDAVYAQGCQVAFPCMIRDAWGVSDDTIQTMEMRIVSAERFYRNDVPFLNNPLKRYNHADVDLEPYPYVSAKDLTMIVVPVVGFDARGNRLGYGAGNYDRYLSQFAALGKTNQTKACRIVGAAFAEQQVEDIPAEKYDVPLAILAL